MPMLYEDKVIGFLAYHMKNTTKKDKKRIISKVLLEALGS
jgi:hypothetical protein